MLRPQRGSAKRGVSDGSMAAAVVKASHSHTCSHSRSRCVRPLAVALPRVPAVTMSRPSHPTRRVLPLRSQVIASYLS